MKLLVTVGAQMPFDRLVAAMDDWAASHPEDEVHAQIGDSACEPSTMRWDRFLDPVDFSSACAGADAIVGHAGTGTLFAAIEHRKPLLVIPRRASRRETRNDHQVATARVFEPRKGLLVAWETEELADRLEELRDAVRAGVAPTGPTGQNTPLLRTIRDFIESPPQRLSFSRRASR